MNALDKLMKRVTIRFPFSINSEEVEDGLLEHLRRELNYNIDYTITLRGYKRQGDGNYTTTERYASEFTVSILDRSRDFAASTCKFLSPEGYLPNFFRGIRFDTVPGSDSIEEFVGVPTGEAQLRLIDEVRENVEKYFSQRNID